MATSLEESASIDRQPALDGKRMIMILSPLSGQKTKVKEEVKGA